MWLSHFDLCRASALHLLASLTVQQAQPAPQLAASYAAPHAGVDVAGLRVLSDIHFREAAPTSSAEETVWTGSSSRDEPRQSVRASPSAAYESVLDALLRGRSGSLGEQTGAAGTFGGKDHMATKTATEARREPQLMMRLLRLCAGWLRAASEPQQIATAASQAAPVAETVCEAFAVLCAWADCQTQPAVGTDQHVFDAFLEVTEAVPAACAATKGGTDPQDMTSGGLSLSGGSASSKPERIPAVDLMLRLADRLWCDTAADESSRVDAIHAAVASGLLQSLAFLPPLRDEALSSQHGEAASEAGSAAAGPGNMSMLLPDGSLDWAAARAAAESLDVRAVHAGLGILLSSSCASPEAAAAAAQQWVPLAESVTLESLTAAIFAAASRCAVPPAGSFAADQIASEDVDFQPEKADDGSESLLGALFADDPDNGLAEETAGKPAPQTVTLWVRCPV